jgi:DNA processing protein
MRPVPTIRNLLIALNTGQDLARESICRLARSLEEWWASSEPLQTLGTRLEVPKADLVTALRLARSSQDLARQELVRAARLGASVLTIADSTYPTCLRQLDLPPPVLYCRGEIPEAPAVAIVGSRQATRPGLDIAELFGRELASCGVTVVSGYARGIDLAAHRGAMSAAGGCTVAVLGCGLDIDYPRGRNRLTVKIASRGALVTEFPFGAAPLARNFPIRNRIIAALSLGTLVVQGTPRSGSLITARLALDLGRDVYAVPGSIFDQRSVGPNTLISDGALLVQHPRDIVESLPVAVQQSLVSPLSQHPSTTPEGAQGELLKHLPVGELVTADSVAATAGQPLDFVLAQLLELELAGLIERCPGSLFCRKP